MRWHETMNMLCAVGMDVRLVLQLDRHTRDSSRLVRMQLDAARVVPGPRVLRWLLSTHPIRHRVPTLSGQAHVWRQYLPHSDCDHGCRVLCRRRYCQPQPRRGWPRPLASQRVLVVCLPPRSRGMHLQRSPLCWGEQGRVQSRPQHIHTLRTVVSKVWCNARTRRALGVIVRSSTRTACSIHAPNFFDSRTFAHIRTHAYFTPTPHPHPHPEGISGLGFTIPPRTPYIFVPLCGSTYACTQVKP